MKILCLYHNLCALPLFNWIKKEGHEIVLCSKRLVEAWCAEQRFDLTVSYTYSHMLQDTVLHALNHNVVNLHNSFLPWNRGADPNLWSILEHTPRGVTLHYIESGLDKGAIIAQRLVPLLPGDTLKTSYDRLDQAAQIQFQEAFQWYPYWQQMKKRPLGNGSYHSVRDGMAIRRLIDTYDMSCDELWQRFQQDGKK